MRFVARLLPLLALYILLILPSAAHEGRLRPDEGRYWGSAEALVEGRYSLPAQLQLWNGPGYAILLSPFAELSLPRAAARFMNGGLLFLAVLYFYLMLRMYVREKTAYLGAYALGLYPPVLQMLPQLMTEPAALFLTCGFVFHFSRIARGARTLSWDLLVAALYLGYLALTKVIFGYVIVLALAVFLVRLVIMRRPADFRSLLVCGIALVSCAPYLAYTHSLTGKTFYWANSGGLSLYWMSSPHNKEYGDWLSPSQTWARPSGDEGQPGKLDKHREFLDSAQELGPTERDEALRDQAIRNIRAHPGKYVENWFANLGRLFFNYPFSYKTQGSQTYIYILPGMFIVVGLAMSLYPGWRARRRVPYEIGALVGFTSIYLGASSVVSAYGRMLFPALPVLILWIVFSLSNLVRARVV
jgi:hypothetical protein